MELADRAYSDLMKELWGSPAVWNMKKTYVDIARKLGVDEETVRNRIKSMKEGGFLLGWILHPNPALLSRKSVFIFLSFDSQEAKESAIPGLAGIAGVAVIASFYGKDVLVTLYDDEEHSATRETTKKMGNGAHVLTSPGMTLPPPLPIKLTPTDWKIMGLLIRNAEKDASEIARELKLSTRTVNRRLNSMMQARAIFITPLVNVKTGGGISYQLIVRTKKEKRSLVEDLIASRVSNLVFRAGMPEGGLIFGFRGLNIAEGNDLLKWAKKLEGVTSAKINIIEDVVHVFDWLEREVNRHAMVDTT